MSGQSEREFGQKAAVYLATVGGVGRLPVAPGTWGSALGLGLGLLAPPVAVIFLAVTFVASALICTQAERALGEKDPRPVILDEVWAMAAVIMALPWIAASPWRLLAGFLLFRYFDIVKPPPLRRLERLPGGWGIMADDLGAGAYTVLILWIVARIAG